MPANETVTRTLAQPDSRQVASFKKGKRVKRSDTTANVPTITEA